MDLRNSIAGLKGRKLKTLGQGKTFRLISFMRDDLAVHVDSSGKDRHIAWHEIAGAFDELQARGELPLSDIRAHRHSEASPVYVAAMLAALPGVTYTTNPIRLRYKRV